MKVKRLGDLLVESGKLSYAQLEEALKNQKTNGKKLGELLVESGVLFEEDIIEVLEMQHGFKRVYLEGIEVEQDIIDMVPESIVTKYTLMPLEIKDGKLEVAMNDPLNIFAIDDLTIATGYEIETLISTKDEILNLVSKYYYSQKVHKAAEELKKEQQFISQDKAIIDNQNEVKEAPVVKLVDEIIINAIRSRTSDIHVEPMENHVKIRYRIDGRLKEVLKVPKETQNALITRIKIMSGMDIAEKRVPQDGRIVTKFDGKDIDFRVSDLPTVFGEKICIRILNKDENLVSMEQLGMNEEELVKLKRIKSSPYGIILVTGPTGSGKSTTLFTLLNELNSPDTNIVTVEDPVEYMIDGVNHVHVNTKAGMTFAAALRSILRQDPDIIMIGEIRDSETAEIAIKASITGHLVLSTIHTNDAASAVVRLTDMGVPNYMVGTAVSGLIAQRLVRRLCPECKKAYKAGEYEKKLLELPEDADITLYKPQGCSQCNKIGYKGRVGVYEIIEVGKEEKEIIMNSRSSEELKDFCINKGMKTLSQSCRELVLNGTTSVDELIKITFDN